jgi:hypothetical protein
MQTSLRVATTSKSNISAEVEYNRGVFTINIPPQVQGVLQQPMRVVMYASIDRSGSMGELANAQIQNSQTKMAFVVSTLNNMVEYIVSQHAEFPHVEFYMSLIVFDSSATCTLPLHRVASDTKDHILNIISQLTPRGGTNFMSCFSEMSKHASAEEENIENDASIPEDFVHRMHVFLTDGQDGVCQGGIPALIKALDVVYPDKSKHKKQPTQIMIGYGVDHDSAMLQRLCSYFPTSKQWFVDDMEKTGCIFGEILWSSINAAFKDVKLKSNVEIYDFASMDWKTELTIGDFAHDSVKTLYTRVPWDTAEVSLQLTYFSTEHPENKSHSHVETIVYNDDNAAIDPEVEKELWRLDTIVTIDEALKFMQNMSRTPYGSLAPEKERILAKVTSFQEKYIAYMNEKNLQDDPFAIQLADDLFVCISGLMSTNLGERYVAARQASQIQQRAVTINDITPLQQEIVSSMPCSSRYNSHSQYAFDNDTYERDDFIQPTRTISSGSKAQNPANSHPEPEPSTPRADADKTEDAGEEAEDAGKEAEDAEDEKIVSSLTPSARGVSTKLRYLSRETIIGIRRNNSHFNEDTPYSCGGDETFSSHATPQCAVVGRMLSAPAIKHHKQDRTPSAPF